MCDRQTLGRWIMNAVGIGTIVALVCVATPGIVHSAQSGGQQQPAADYEKMWKATFTDAQWLSLLRQRVHQPIAIWKGIMAGEIEANGTSMSYYGVQFEDSRSNVLERQLLLNGLFATQPLAFLPLLDDPDPEIVLTGASVYVKAMNSGEFRPEELGEAKTKQIVMAIREKLLPHRDVRIRWVAVDMLSQSTLMTPQDVKQGMNDPTDAIRIVTAGCLRGVMAKWIWDTDPDNAEEPAWGKKLTRDELRRYDAILAEVLLDHVNDTHFFVRSNAAEAVRGIFLRRVNDILEANPTKKGFAAPRDFDWVRSEWQRRATTQKTWKGWWKQNGVPAPAAGQ